MRTTHVGSAFVRTDTQSKIIRYYCTPKICIVNRVNNSLEHCPSIRRAITITITIIQLFTGQRLQQDCLYNIII